MASERQLIHQDYLIMTWRTKARNMRGQWDGYMALIEELHHLAAFAQPYQAELMVQEMHPMHRTVVRHYLEMYGAFDSA